MANQFTELKVNSFFVEYRLVRKLGEGTFSEVLKAESVKTRQKVAIKCMKSHFDNIEQVSYQKQLCFVKFANTFFAFRYKIYVKLKLYNVYLPIIILFSSLKYFMTSQQVDWP